MAIKKLGRYRRVKAKSALLGKRVRDVTVELYQRWLAEELPVSSRQSPEQWLEEWLRLGEEALRVEKLSSRGKFKDINFTIRSGEVVGLRQAVNNFMRVIGPAAFGPTVRALGLLPLFLGSSVLLVVAAYLSRPRRKH